MGACLTKYIPNIRSKYNPDVWQNYLTNMTSIKKSCAKICQIAIFRKKERSKHKGQSNSMSDSMNSLKNNLKLGQNRVSPIILYLFEYKTSLTFEVRHFWFNFYWIRLLNRNLFWAYVQKRLYSNKYCIKLVSSVGNQT